jgi:hypothetical protein
MEPVHYLRTYCKLGERRRAMYRRIFEKYKTRVNKEDVLNAEQLEEAIMVSGRRRSYTRAPS